jgi:hypothetical protein
LFTGGEYLQSFFGRECADERGRRAQALAFFGSVGNDPNKTPDVRLIENLSPLLDGLTLARPEHDALQPAVQVLARTLDDCVRSLAQSPGDGEVVGQREIV